MDTPINLPAFDIKIRSEGNQLQVFDSIRRKFVAFTPEERVRQYFINYLLFYKSFPSGLLAVEQPVMVNNMNQRVDIVAFNRKGEPLLIVECKAPSVNLTRDTYAQAARYNLTLKANYLVVTNGVNHFCSRIDLVSKNFYSLSEVPNYNEIG
jgi:hypothetical protein